MPFEAPITLSEGDLAPDFCAQDQSGVEVSLSKLRGKPVLLYFYPKDNTPGCTKEACAFRDQFSVFEKKGVQIIGVSPDSVKSHEKFSTKLDLPFPLLADVDKEIVQAYGVWGEKKFMGRTYDGTFRASFLIDSKGKILKIWPKVKAELHPEEVLEFL
jgi:peroxiredoxin Q/BCP